MLQWLKGGHPLPGLSPANEWASCGYQHSAFLPMGDAFNGQSLLQCSSLSSQHFLRCALWSKTLSSESCFRPNFFSWEFYLQDRPKAHLSILLYFLFIFHWNYSLLNQMFSWLLPKVCLGLETKTDIQKVPLEASSCRSEQYPCYSVLQELQILNGREVSPSNCCLQLG